MWPRCTLGHYWQVLAGADWLGDRPPAAAAAVVSVGRTLYAVTCQSLADALPSCAVPSAHRQIDTTNV